MAKRRKKKNRRNRRQTGCNRHHILYQARHWTTPFAKQLRNAMNRSIPIGIHNELHNEVLRDVPKPSEKLLETAWKAYQADKTTIDAYDIQKLILWLYDAIPDEAFRACMMVQYRFFDNRKGDS